MPGCILNQIGLNGANWIVMIYVVDLTSLGLRY